MRTDSMMHVTAFNAIESGVSTRRSCYTLVRHVPVQRIQVLKRQRGDVRCASTSTRIVKVYARLKDCFLVSYKQVGSRIHAEVQRTRRTSKLAGRNHRRQGMLTRCKQTVWRPLRCCQGKLGPACKELAADRDGARLA